MGFNGSYRQLLIMAIAYFFIQLQFWFPIWVVFLLDRGLDIEEVVLADIIYWIAVVLLEFPMGVISDRIGRRKTFFVAAMFGSLAYYFMLLIHSLQMLLLTWFMWAVYISTISGTDNAYIYELIVEAGLQHRIKYIFGYFDSLRNIALFISTLLAGFFYTLDMRLPILLNSVFAFSSALIILLLPRVKIMIRHAPTEQVQRIVDLVKNNPKVRYYLIFMAVLYTYIWASTLPLQPLLLSFGIPISQFGIIYATFPLFATFGGFSVGRVSDRLGDRNHIILTTSLVVFSMLLIGILPVPWGITGIIFLQFSYSLLQPLLLSKINEEVENDLRASILSFGNLIGSFGLIFCRPLIIFIGQLTTVQDSYFLWGIGGFSVLLLSLFTVLKSE